MSIQIVHPVQSRAIISIYQMLVLRSSYIESGDTRRIKSLFEYHLFLF